MRDTDVLLAIGVLALVFVAYEMSALRGAPWRTVSWYSQRRWYVRFGVVLLIVGVAVWFLWHTSGGQTIPL